MPLPRQPLDMFADVYDFQEKFGAHIEQLPTFPPVEVITLRDRIIEEEVNEELLPDLHKPKDSSLIPERLAAVADHIADSIYVLLGTAVSYGIDIRPVWEEVHRKNMQKSRDNKRADGKISKPPGWTAPNVAAILARQAPLPLPRDLSNAFTE
jgi:predicted HAD superfamily Cof-like phosphohydrolase